MCHSPTGEREDTAKSILFVETACTRARATTLSFYVKIVTRTEGVILSERNEAIKLEIEIMKKEILYFADKKRARARRAYYRLLKSSGKIYALNEPIYLKRSE